VVELNSLGRAEARVASHARRIADQEIVTGVFRGPAAWRGKDRRPHEKARLEGLGRGAVGVEQMPTAQDPERAIFGHSGGPFSDLQQPIMSSARASISGLAGHYAARSALIRSASSGVKCRRAIFRSYRL
jgi:hypothetical protein